MTHQYACPECRVLLQSPRGVNGSKVKCLGCMTVFVADTARSVPPTRIRARPLAIWFSAIISVVLIFLLVTNLKRSDGVKTGSTGLRHRPNENVAGPTTTSTAKAPPLTSSAGNRGEEAPSSIAGGKNSPSIPGEKTGEPQGPDGTKVAGAGSSSGRIKVWEVASER